MVDVLEKTLYYFKACLEPYGFEVYPFLIDWYNELVDTPFKLPYPRSTLAYVVLSTPRVFENVFIPFIKESPNDIFEEIRDPIDAAVNKKLEGARTECTLVRSETIELIHDYDLTPNRRPRILMQTAAAVAGAIQLYREQDLEESYKFETKSGKIFPCALHPEYGGWFAIRGVYIFNTLINPLLERPQKLHILQSQVAIQDFLKRFNLNWTDWTYRDVIEPIERYSKIQRQYFETPPRDRRKFHSLLKEYEYEEDDEDTEEAEEAEETEEGEDENNEDNAEKSNSDTRHKDSHGT